MRLNRTGQHERRSTLKKIIITADDYGMSAAVNRAIDEGVDCGVITSTNVMTNMPFYQDAVRLKETKASIGIHWNLTCGYPVLSGSEIPSLVQENGEFHGYNDFRTRFRQGRINGEDIARELQAQYHLFHELLGEPDYWNTHENCHVDFKIFQLFVSIARELKISKMRSHQRIYVRPKEGKGSYSLKWRMIEPVKSGILDSWQNKAHRAGISSPDGRICCLEDSDSHDVQYVMNHIRWGNKTVGEYAFHPAVECDSRFFGDMTDNRITEYAIATDKNTLRYIRDAGIELVNFDSV